jgi:CO dehydrogenase/acetyl-CoA synthase delta subunit
VNWETTTAASLIYAGADLMVLRHPESLRLLRAMVDELAQAA